MWCNICRNEFEAASGICPVCGTDVDKVQVLSPDEREDFNGITIEQGPAPDREEQTHSPFTKTFVFNSSSAGPLTRLLLGALLLIAVVVFLPLVIIFAATFGLGWLTNRGRQ